MPADLPSNAKGLELAHMEQLYMTMRPHVIAFFRYFAVGVLMMIWSVVVYVLYLQGWLTYDALNDDVNALVPALFIGVGAILMAWLMVAKFRGGFQVLFWVVTIALFVVSALIIWYWDDPDLAPHLAALYGILMGVGGIIAGTIYRRAFTYYITNQRIVIRYKFLSVKENNYRFEKIEDFKIVRSLFFRLFGLGTIRVYTGTEDGKADPDRTFDGPDEALYGIRKPAEVKQKLVEIILEKDRYAQRMVDILEGREGGVPATPTATAPVEDEEPEEEVPAVAYYRPAPPPEEVAPAAPTRNYERVDPAMVAPARTRPIPPPGPSHEATEQPAPPPVRRMYPEERETRTEFTLEDGASMDFQRPSPGQGAPSKKRRPVLEDDDPYKEVYDEGKPRAL